MDNQANQAYSFLESKKQDTPAATDYRQKPPNFPVFEVSKSTVASLSGDQCPNLALLIKSADLLVPLSFECPSSLLSQTCRKLRNTLVFHKKA